MKGSPGFAFNSAYIGQKIASRLPSACLTSGECSDMPEGRDCNARIGRDSAGGS
jgi:hypothetical protein